METSVLWSRMPLFLHALKGWDSFVRNLRVSGIVEQVVAELEGGAERAKARLEQVVTPVREATAAESLVRTTGHRE
jgi:hypothetical protein